jgi:hypothetical protein
MRIGKGHAAARRINAWGVAEQLLEEEEGEEEEQQLLLGGYS